MNEIKEEELIPETKEGKREENFTIFSLSTLYQYLFTDRADIYKNLDKIKGDKEKALKQRRKKIKDFFDTMIRSREFPRNDTEENLRGLLHRLGNKNAKVIEEIYFSSEQSVTDIPESKKNFEIMETLKENFLKLNKQYPFFPEPISDRENDQRFYEEIRKILLLICFAKGITPIESDNFLITDVYKILAIFGSIKEFDTYIKNHNLYDEKLRFSKALDALPAITYDPAYIQAWRKIIQESGPQAWSFFYKHGALLQKQTIIPKNLDHARSAVRRHFYGEEGEKNPRLADLCIKHNAFQETFQGLIEARKNIKKQDFTPDIMIDGAAIGHPGYYFLKLPADDPHTVEIGDINRTCLHGAHDQGHEFIVTLLTSPHNQLYVLIKAKSDQYKKDNPLLSDGRNIDHSKFEIVGHAYGWWSKFKKEGEEKCSCSWTWNSWNNKRAKIDGPINLQMIECFSKALFSDQRYPKVEMITLGRRNLPSYFQRPTKKLEGKEVPRMMIEGQMHPDARHMQYVIYDREQHAAYLKGTSGGKEEKISEERKISLVKNSQEEDSEKSINDLKEDDKHPKALSSSSLLPSIFSFWTAHQSKIKKSAKIALTGAVAATPIAIVIASLVETSDPAEYFKRIGDVLEKSFVATFPKSPIPISAVIGLILLTICIGVACRSRCLKREIVETPPLHRPA